MLDFEGTGTPRNRIVNFIEIIRTVSSLYRFMQWNSSALNSAAYSRTTEIYVTVWFTLSVTNDRLNCTMWFKSQMIQFNRTRDDNIGVVWVMQRRFIPNALSATSIQEVQRVFNNLFTGCHGCLRVGGGHFQRLHYGGTSYMSNCKAVAAHASAFCFQSNFLH